MTQDLLKVLDRQTSQVQELVTRLGERLSVTNQLREFEMERRRTAVKVEELSQTLTDLLQREKALQARVTKREDTVIISPDVILVELQHLFTEVSGTAVRKNEVSAPTTAHVSSPSSDLGRSSTLASLMIEDADEEEGGGLDSLFQDVSLPVTISLQDSEKSTPLPAEQLIENGTKLPILDNFDKDELDDLFGGAQELGGVPSTQSWWEDDNDDLSDLPVSPSLLTTEETHNERPTPVLVGEPLGGIGEEEAAPALRKGIIGRFFV